MRPVLRLLALLLTLNSQLLTETKAQAPKTYTSSEILLGLQKLNVLGSVLYIAAHPDDENTRLLAYLANERLVETAYLSVTRGDGGQNLIGPELREGLGLIRTQELLAARRLDGAQQFFTRANDFGFSKTSDETFRIWDKEQLLSDMVWVIRQRRPDVLITRFPPDARAGHGHHAASAILAADAFDAAGDPKRFPEQLQYVQPWQPKRLLWNISTYSLKPGETIDPAGKLVLDVGGYNPLLGKSYGEIAALSRSQHRSQGFGSAATRGEAIEYFQLVKGEPVKTDLFDGVDLTWGRVPGGAQVGKLVEGVIRGFDAGNPAASVAGLVAINKKARGLLAEIQYETSTILLEKLEHMQAVPTEQERRAIKRPYEELGSVIRPKLDDIIQLIAACSGLHVECVTNSRSIAPDNLLAIDIERVNRVALEVVVGEIKFQTFNCAEEDTVFTKTLTKGQSFRLKTDKLFGDADASQPYWLREPHTSGMYAIPESFPSGRGDCHYGTEMLGAGMYRGMPEAPAYPSVAVNVTVKGSRQDKEAAYLWLEVPVQYKHTDPTLGELYEPLVVVPPVMVNLPAARAYVFADAQPKAVPVTLRAGKAQVAGTLTLAAPAGWQVEPAAVPFALKSKDDEQTVTFQLRPLPAAAPGRAELRATATVAGVGYSRGIQTIRYPHIPTQTLFPDATDPLVKLDVQTKGQQIGYLMGAGDEVPEALRQLGYTVTILDAASLSAAALARFDAVVLGIRAYNTVEQLKTKQPELLKYVENGGNLVVQYTVNRGTVLPEIGPYPLTLSRDRVTVENAPVTFLAPKHPLLNTPNKITAADFTGWVQEQGLYYPSAWDPRYTPIIASNDPSEDPKKGAILVADYGRGHYIYTGLSLFRELPAGVPGAYRILANLVSYGK